MKTLCKLWNQKRIRPYLFRRHCTSNIIFHGLIETTSTCKSEKLKLSDLCICFVSVGKNCPVNGELNRSSPETAGSLSQGSATDKTGTETKASPASRDSKQPATKPFDINDFFMSDSLIPFTGGVSYSTI